MKKLIFGVALNLVIVAVANAQKPVTADKITRLPPTWQENRPVSSGELTPTPEMWFYEQERRRWEDPMTIVRARAQEKTAERRARLAAMAWYGMSNSRPNVSIDPTDSVYAQHWRSNGYQPSEWVGGVSHQTVILEADRGGKNY